MRIMLNIFTNISFGSYHPGFMPEAESKFAEALDPVLRLARLERGFKTTSIHEPSGSVLQYINHRIDDPGGALADSIV